MRRVLDGQHFAGPAGRAYRAAAEIPDVLDHLYCYCECEPAIGHKSLKSCFVDLHGAIAASASNRPSWPGG
ncbi:MAG: PCYCGC domain-containing protein [Gammaproteobacteria bacterium]|nr:PCYCGC domain-containing protein [Gammaproteobacteria bacterium]